MDKGGENVKEAPVKKSAEESYKHLNSHTEIFSQIKNSKTPTVINYGASWCRVCSQILPSFCQFSEEFPKRSFVYADIDECPETTQHIR